MPKPSRLRGFNTSIVSQILPEKFSEVEAAFNKAVPIHESDAFASLWLLAHAGNNPQKFTQRDRGLANQPDFPSGVNNLKDVFHGRPDFKNMTADERLAWVEANPGYAEALLRGRKSND
jgi:hypothetical protein